MCPDINTLRSSRSSRSNSITSPGTYRNASTFTGSLEALRDQTPSPSRSASTSLAAAAAMNSGLHHESTNMGRRPSSGSISRNMTSPRTGRRQSTVLMNLQFNDPSIPGLGEMANENHPISYRGSVASSPMSHASDPYRGRHPSLGELHQELEQEQEAHVNRLLHQIRQQQIQLDQLQGRAGGAGGPTGSAIDESPGSAPPRSSYEFVRTPSRTASPQIRSSSFTDESAQYQAETQMMIRENQMLRARIRELERQVHESTPSATTHEPVLHSNLLRSESVEEEQSTMQARTLPNRSLAFDDEKTLNQ